MSNREERRAERRQARAIRAERPVYVRPIGDAERVAHSRRNRVLGGFFTIIVGALFVLGSFTVVPPRVGAEPSIILAALLAERGISVERLDAATLDALAAPGVLSPAELLAAAQKEVNGLTPTSTDIVLVTATDPAPAPGSEPVRFNRAPAYAYRFTAPDGGYLSFGGARFKTAVLLINPFTGSPMIGAGYEPEQPAPSPPPVVSPSASPSASP